MSRSENQYNFFKNVCLDDNGLLCGIQDVINGLQNITTVVSGNTEAINNIDINVQHISEEMVFVNSNIEELNGIVGEIKTCVCDTPPTPHPPSPTPNPINKGCCCKPSKRISYQPTRCCTHTIKAEGYNIVVNRIPTHDRFGNPRKFPVGYVPPTPPPPVIPTLDIPYGYRNPDGTYTRTIPASYIDSSGQQINVVVGIGTQNLSAASQTKEGVTYV